MSTVWLVLIVVGSMAVAAFLGGLIGYTKGWDDAETHRAEKAREGMRTVSGYCPTSPCDGYCVICDPDMHDHGPGEPCNGFCKPKPSRTVPVAAAGRMPVDPGPDTGTWPAA